MKLKNKLVRKFSNFVNLYPVKNYFKKDSLLEILKHDRLTSCIDVGANTGQFLLRYWRYLKDSKLFVFEPQITDFLVLRNSFSELSNVVMYNIALGEKNGFLPLHVNDFSPSSSLLPLANNDIFTHLKEIDSCQVEVGVLDLIVDERLLGESCLLKIDVQGYELFVLSGAVNLLKSIKYLYIEYSTVVQYHNQPSFDDIYIFIRKHGFKLLCTNDNLFNRGRAIQADAIFINESFCERN